MRNHVHCILSSADGTLSDTLRDLKRHTAKQILLSVQSETESRLNWLLQGFRQAATAHVRNKDYQVWTHENHAVGIDGHISEMFASRLNYIHNNPVKEGLVENASDYMYSSARDYVGRKGLVNLYML